MYYTVEQYADGWYVISAVGGRLGPYTSELQATLARSEILNLIVSRF